MAHLQTHDPQRLLPRWFPHLSLLPRLEKLAAGPGMDLCKSLLSTVDSLAHTSSRFISTRGSESVSCHGRLQCDSAVPCAIVPPNLFVVAGMWPSNESWLHVGLSENSVPLHPMVLLIIIPTKWLFHWGYTPFSDTPMWRERA